MMSLFDFSAFPVLTTARLRLRQMTAGDAAAIMAIFGSAEGLRYLNNDPTDTPEKAAGLIDWLNGEFERKEGVTWGITQTGDDTVIGTAGTYGWDQDNRRVDIGYHIQPAQWGKGYATEAAQAGIGWSFEQLQVHRIQADCTDGNAGSERVLLKCGFKVEGIWRESCWEHGRFVDIKQFGLLRREYVGG